MRPDFNALSAARLLQLLGPLFGAPRQTVVFAPYPDPGNAQPPSATKMADVVQAIRQSAPFDLGVAQIMIALMIEPASAADFAHLMVKLCLADYARHVAKKKIHVQTRQSVLTTLSAEMYSQAKARFESIEAKDRIALVMDLWLKLFAFYIHQANRDPRPPTYQGGRVLLSCFHYPTLPLPAGEVAEFFTKIAEDCNPRSDMFKRPMGMTIEAFVKASLDQIVFDARLTMFTSAIAVLSSLACAAYITCYDFEMQVLLAFLIGAFFVMANIFRTVYHYNDNPALALGQSSWLSHVEHTPCLHDALSWLSCLSWQRGSLGNVVRFSRHPWVRVFTLLGELGADESEKPWGFPFDQGKALAIDPNGEISYQKPERWESKTNGAFIYDEKQIQARGGAVYPVFDADMALLFFAVVNDSELHELVFPLLLNGLVGPQRNGFKRSYPDFQSWCRDECTWMLRLNGRLYPEERRCQLKGGQGYPLVFFAKEPPPKPAESEPKKTL